MFVVGLKLACPLTVLTRVHATKSFGQRVGRSVNPAVEIYARKVK